ncbi:HlyD family secretion protein [Methylobacterium nonmethylotrophicum]|uniref:HlyD family secretion protein n=2 Tax=Methylobacterium nonmethylotrophicum TaxID=1141884 RepID=A0A4Z0NTT1_9HYPH|nr:HlyD family secretion protein [Methylobacterium nonmethylotrophicum]
MLGASLGLAYLAYLYYADTPWTRDGRVRVYTVQVAPEVSGTVVRLNVKDNQFVRKGDILFEIDPGTFRNAVTQAEGALDAAKAQASYLTGIADRTSRLTDLAATPQQRQTTRGQADAANATIVQMQGAFAQAQLNLERTTLRATVNGWVTNLLLQEGGFATMGQPALTLVNADSFWVEGYFEETQFPRIADGDAAHVTLMAWPRTPIRGHVTGLGRGISVSNATPGVQGLPTVNPIFTWVRLAQRVPIRIELDDVPCPIVIAAGMTANVSILDTKAPGAPPPDGRPRIGLEAGFPCGQGRVVGRKGRQ